jgi:threonine synthase
MAILRCPACGAEEQASSARYECACGELFEVEHSFRLVGREVFDARGLHSAPPLDSGVWRFRELVYPQFPSEAVVSLREGNTPLYASESVASFVGVEQVKLKHEGQNPSGSFKDRGMTVAVSRAKASGARRLLCASTGNTAASLAAYAASAGIPCAILAPAGKTSAAKLAQATAYGAQSILVRGDFDHAMSLSRELARTGEVELVNSLNPFRLEGQKSIVFELLAQLGWRAPDWIAFPAGNLGNCSAFGKALREARYLGLIDRTPRLLAVQAEGAAPFARAFAQGWAQRVTVTAETRASAIRIGAPVSWSRAERAIRETHGHVLAVSDAELDLAKRTVDRAGIGCELASAAGVAGARELVRRGVIGPEESVVAILTANLLKEPSTESFESATIEPKLDALRRALET